eukprot:87198-Pelagomonas_calceolata.AAC.5
MTADTGEIIVVEHAEWSSAVTLLLHCCSYIAAGSLHVRSYFTTHNFQGKQRKEERGWLPLQEYAGLHKTIIKGMWD